MVPNASPSPEAPSSIRSRQLRPTHTTPPDTPHHHSPRLALPPCLLPACLASRCSRYAPPPSLPPPSYLRAVPGPCLLLRAAAAAAGGRPWSRPAPPPAEPTTTMHPPSTIKNTTLPQPGLGCHGRQAGRQGAWLAGWSSEPGVASSSCGLRPYHLVEESRVDALGPALGHLEQVRHGQRHLPQHHNSQSASQPASEAVGSAGRQAGRWTVAVGQSVSLTLWEGCLCLAKKSHQTATSTMSGTHSTESMQRVYVTIVCGQPRKPDQTGTHHTDTQTAEGGIRRRAGREER